MIEDGCVAKCAKELMESQKQLEDLHKSIDSLAHVISGRLHSSVAHFSNPSVVSAPRSVKEEKESLPRSEVVNSVKMAIDSIKSIEEQVLIICNSIE